MTRVWRWITQALECPNDHSEACAYCQELARRAFDVTTF